MYYVIYGIRSAVTDGDALNMAVLVALSQELSVQLELCILRMIMTSFGPKLVSVYQSSSGPLSSEVLFTSIFTFMLHTI